MPAFAEPRSRADATAAPAGANDTTEGYAVGSEWCDVSSDRSYICLDATEGAAVWKETTPPPPGTIDHDQTLNFDINKHRPINDAGTGTNEVWSASKTSSEISTLSAGLIKKAGVKTTTFGEGDITLSGEQTLNGFPTSASRVLVVEQTLPEENGIYDTAAGAWSRALDADGTPSNEVANGNTLEVLDSGSTDFKSHYTLVTADPITVGTTAQDWERHPDIAFGTTGGTAAEGNDSRIPSQDENDALVGTDGTPSAANPLVTTSDPRNSDARTPTAHAGTHTSGADDIQDANSGQKGLATAAQITKLGGIETGATADQTNAEIKTAYEANADTNAFLDAEKTKLTGVETSADVTDAANVAAAGAVMDSDISAAEGFLRKTGAGAYEALKSNLGATTSPGTGDDNTVGYAIGSRWINVSADKEFVCLDATTGVAVWIETTGSAAGGKNDFVLSFPEITTASPSYELAAGGRFIFRGTTALGIPAAIKIVGGNNGSSTADFRIFDFTNALQVAEILGNADVNPSVISMGTLSNLPTGEAVFQVEFLRKTGSGGSNVPAVCGANVQF